MSDVSSSPDKTTSSPVGWGILLVLCCAGGVLIIRDNMAINDTVKKHCPPDQITSHVKSFKPYLRELRCAVPMKKSSDPG